MSILYFAYGSNMLTARMQERIGLVCVYGTAYLNGWQVICNKCSKDGSGKANLVKHEGSIVWGVIYEVDKDDLAKLDRFEKGYDRVVVTVSMEQADNVEVLTYVADRVTDQPIAYDWYRNLIVAGAEEHGLPDRYITQLRQMPVREHT